MRAPLLGLPKSIYYLGGTGSSPVRAFIFLKLSERVLTERICHSLDRTKTKKEVGG